MELDDPIKPVSATRELFRFLERGLLLGMGSIAVGSWALMILRCFSDFDPWFELATHTSLHAFVGCLALLAVEMLFFILRRHSIQAGPRWKRRVIFTLVPFIFFMWVTSPWRLLSLTPVQEKEGSIKILAWNILLVNRHAEELLEIIDREKPDVIALIELSPYMAKQLDDLRVEYPHALLMPEWQASGMAVLSRLPESKLRSFYPANSWIPAIELEADRPSGEKLSLLTVHTLSPNVGNGSRTLIRDIQLKELGAWARQKKNGALIVGDFNVSPWSPPYWRLLKEGGLADSRWYRGYFSSWPTHLGWFGIPIDHALVNSQIQVLDRRNLFESTYSDHCPVLITIQ